MTPGRPAATRTNRLLIGAVGALCTALTLGVLSGPAAEAAPVTTSAINVVGAAAQCDMGLGRPQKGTAAKARALMAGRAQINEYGWFHLAANPSWKPVSTLDSSGKGYMHSLHYLLPLLRRGVKTGNKAMIDRFYFLVHDWFKDNKPGGPTSRYAWGPPIYEGFRSLVLVCAAAGPRGNAPWLLKALKQNGEMAARADRYEGINNASLHQSMGLYAIGVAIGRPAWRRLAIARIRALVVRLVHEDGSDEEGAPNYAINNYRWFNQAAERMRRAGDPVPPELSRVDATPAFIAHATRPDGRVEALGDGFPSPLGPTAWLGTAAEWSSTGGASGFAPSDTMTAYAGGYVFGRSGWGSADPAAGRRDLLQRPGRAGQRHPARARRLGLAHVVLARLAAAARHRAVGVPLRHHPQLRGVPRGAQRRARRRRRRGRGRGPSCAPAGSTVWTSPRWSTAATAAWSSPAPSRTTGSRTSWSSGTGCRRTRSVRASQQWGLGRDRAVSLDGDAVHTSGPGANLSMLFTSGGAPQDLAVGKKSPMRGWNSQSYGELSPAPSVRATQKGSSLSWLTVLAPRADGVPASSVTASASVSSAAASVALSTAAGSATVNLDDISGSRTAATTMTPTAVPTAPVVLAGTDSRVRALGLTPSAPVTLESSPTGAGTWTPVSTGKASAAGTVSIPVTVPATADYRVVSGLAASAPVTVVAAFPPQPPVNVVATPTGRGQVTVTWQPPADTGGVPLTQYAIRDRRQTGRRPGRRRQRRGRRHHAGQPRRRGCARSTRPPCRPGRPRRWPCRRTRR